MEEVNSQESKVFKWIKRAAAVVIVGCIIYALYPKVEAIANSAKRTADIANARNIYNNMAEMLILDEIDAPKKSIYVDLSDNPPKEEDAEENKIDVSYIYKVKGKLDKKLNYYSKYTKLDKNKSFVVYITKEGELKIYVSPVASDEIEEIYPLAQGIYK